MLWNLDEVYKALDIKKKINENFLFNEISIDSRKINKKSLFIPIEGKNYDGHKFIDSVARKGVKACLIEKKKKHLIKNKKILLIEVNNTLISLKKLALYARNRIRDLKTICVTGSNGKTTLKEWLKETLKNNFVVYSNPGNFNNLIGMPITLVNIPKNTEICILELGMNTYGEIKELARIARPDIAIITNIGNAHIGNFKNRFEIAKEKSDIFSFLEGDSIAIIPGDSDHFKLLDKKAKAKTNQIITFGKDPDFQSKYEEEKNDIFSFNVSETKIKLKKKIIFKNWENNILIILSVMNILKLNLKKNHKKLESLRPLPGRGEILQIKKRAKKFFLIDESYNSNPNSLKMAILDLNKEKYKLNEKILVIGDMLELGKFSRKMHQEIVPIISNIQPKLVITVGEFSRVISESLPSNISSFHFKKVFHVYNKLSTKIDNNDIVMVKGSNSTKLSMLIKFLSQGM